MQAIIQTNKLRKVYRADSRRKAQSGSSADVVALDALDLEVSDGEFFGLLGPNGAGKTTTIGILTTLTRPTSGDARVAGIDVSADAPGVRARIAVVPQRPNADRSLNVFENLVFHAAYFGVPKVDAEPRAISLLEKLSLVERREARVDALSGGQQQRLMIARALMHDPKVLFLDEPTVGLDPQARLALWDILRDVQASGRTIVMTTHYMEEADRLCDRIAIVDHGRLLALDTPANLKAKAPGGTLIELQLDRDVTTFSQQFSRIAGVSRVVADRDAVRIHTEKPGEVIAAAMQIVDAEGALVRDIHLLRPSLETLFIDMTGRKLA